MLQLIFFLVLIIFNLNIITRDNEMDIINTELKKELEEYGFQLDHIELATQISRNKEEVLNL